jgi:hypothetical protein
MFTFTNFTAAVFKVDGEFLEKAFNDKSHTSCLQRLDISNSQNRCNLILAILSTRERTPTPLKEVVNARNFLLCVLV